MATAQPLICYESFAAGANIITEGEEGNAFYILEEGEASAMKSGEKVFSYQSGGFFGELALLKNEPRAATVVADSACKCLVLNRGAFSRLFGGANELAKLKAQAIRYSQTLAKQEKPE